MRITILHE